MRKLLLPTTAALFILAGCSTPNPRVVTKLNESAALTGDLPADPLQWKVITSGVDRRDATMYTLFGNDAAVQHARTSTQHDYPSGSVLSLITWTQQEDRRWFGANIPAVPKSAEFVTVKAGADGRISYSYVRYEGTPLKKIAAQDAPTANGRAGYLLSQRAAVMP